jgi:hypothetical protein
VAVDALVEQTGDEAIQPIPEERQKSLLTACEEAAAVDQHFKKYAATLKQFQGEVVKAPGTELVEPVPGVFAVRYKSPFAAKVPKVEVKEH